MTAAEIGELLERQRAFLDSGRLREVGFRRERLRALAGELDRRSGEILDALGEDLGKPPLEAWLSEVYFLRSEIGHTVKKLPGWARPRRVSSPFYFLPARSEVRREAFGCVMIAAPWNYPVQLALSPLVAAVAGGNCVVLKPSELAPASSQLLAGIVADVFDPGHVAVVEGGAELGAALLEAPFDFFFFTGGEKVGRLVAAAAARQLVPAILELGGKCPCLIAEDADLDRVVERVVATKFFNAGQTCVAPDFVMVPAALHEAFVAKCTAEIERNYGRGRSGDLARIVNARHYRRLRGLCPAETIRIGEDDEAQCHLAPRLIPDAGWDSAAMREEIFGPVLPVLPYDDLDAVLRRLARGPAPLALYAFSPRSEWQEMVAAALPSGMVCFNDAMKPAANPHLPLGGVGASGMGRYHGRAGFESLTYARSVTRRWLWKDPFLVKPPFDGQLERLRKFLK